MLQKRNRSFKVLSQNILQKTVLDFSDSTGVKKNKHNWVLNIKLYCEIRLAHQDEHANTIHSLALLPNVECCTEKMA